MPCDLVSSTEVNKQHKHTHIVYTKAEAKNEAANGMKKKIGFILFSVTRSPSAFNQQNSTTVFLEHSQQC